MFAGCTSLTTAPDLLSTRLANGCYYQMFKGCTSLTHIKAMFINLLDPTVTPYVDPLYEWVSGVSDTGMFIKNADAAWDVTGVGGVPEGWTVQTASS